MIDPQPQQLDEEMRLAILNALSSSIASKRDEAVAARASSGIEDDWTGDEEFYQGYDDANRHEFTQVTRKPTAAGGSSEPTAKRRGSTVFPNITQPYVDAAAARVGDMLLPTDDRNFAIEPTPIPDMLPKDEPPVPQAQPMQQPGPQGQPMPGQPPEQMGMMGAQPPAAPQMVQLPDGSQMPLDEARDKFAAFKKEAERKAEKAQDHIDDWLTESQSNAEIRKVIHDSANIGTGVLKGPVPVNRKSRQMRSGENGYELVIAEEIKPASFRIDAWNLFPDGACGESIHNGSHIFERDFLTPKKLADLKSLPGYLKNQIELCLDEGPIETAASAQVGQTSTKGQFVVWYFHGEIPADELMAAGCECEDSNKSYPVMLTMVNNRVIRASLNPLDSGEFPYDLIAWKRRPGMPWGMGISRQMRTPQRIVVAATRNMMDNAGQGAGPQFVIRQGVEPVDGKWEISPLKLWRENDESNGQSGPPFLSVVVPMLQVELTNIIQLGMKMAEDVTGMPQLLQGNQGNAPDTVGGMQILNSNSNAVLRRIARLFDSCITEPHIRRYYAWLMEYGEDDDEKGDFQIVARGSTALVERDIQSSEMPQILQMCLNPAFGANPKKAFNEYLKSRRFDPAAFEYSEEEQKQMESQQPPPPPQIQVAQIRAQADAEKTKAVLAQEAQIAQLENHTAQTRIKVDMDRDTTLVEAQHEKNINDSQLRLRELEVKERLAMLEYANKNQITLDTLKTKLAERSMTLNVQRELASAAHEMDIHKTYNPPQVATPAFEPAGKAKPGEAFQA